MEEKVRVNQYMGCHKNIQNLFKFFDFSKNLVHHDECETNDAFCDIHYCLILGISLEFAATMFSTWLKEKDINAICASLKKQQIDSRLMVSTVTCVHLSGCCHVIIGSFTVYSSHCRCNEH